MDERLDPGCEGARALEERHRTQTMLLVGGPESQLGSIVRQTQDRQILAHVGVCARCSSWRQARCGACGFDLRYERHGWRCPEGPTSWSDWLPWNWRARHAPDHGGTSAPTRDPHAPPPDAATRASGPPRHRHVPVQQAPSVPPRRSVAPPAAKPSASPLSHAYATLGLKTTASAAEVRKAFRERAQQYHPDKVAHMAPEFRYVAEQKMKEINSAYERIKRVL